MKKNHFFIVTLTSESRVDSAVMKNSAKTVTAKMIAEAITSLRLDDTATVTSVSYMGKMSDDEYTTGNRKNRITPELITIVTTSIIAVALLIQITLPLWR